MTVSLSDSQCWLLFLLMSHVICVQAMIPVIDVDAIAQLSNEYKQLEQQSSQLSSINSINDGIRTQTENLVTDSEGHYGYGNLMNSDADLQDKQYSPDSWDDALKGLSGGNDARYQQLLSEYQQKHPTMSADDFAEGSTTEDAENYQQQVDTNSAAAVNATYAFNDINGELDTVHDLSGKIEQSNNTKAAVDLNSRLAVELAYIQIESLKMQTVLNQQLADQTASSIDDQAQEATYSTLPPDDN